jgi:hypothetical protein
MLKFFSIQQQLFVIIAAIFTSSCITKQDEVKAVNDNMLLDTVHTLILKDGHKILDIKNISLGKRELVILKANKLLAKVNLPTKQEYNGFAVNWIKSAKTGFQLSIEYGSRIYYQKKFNFEYKQGNFYLKNIETESFDKQTNKNSKTKITNLNPEVSINKVVFNNYKQ